MHPEPLAAVAQPENQSDQDRTSCCGKANSQWQLSAFLVLRQSEHPDVEGLNTYPRLRRFCKVHSTQQSVPRVLLGGFDAGLRRMFPIRQPMVISDVHAPPPPRVWRTPSTWTPFGVPLCSRTLALLLLPPVGS